MKHFTEYRFTDVDKLKEVERELGLRWSFYTRQVQAGRMTQALMDRRIALLQAVKDDYERLVQGRML